MSKSNKWQFFLCLVGFDCRRRLVSEEYIRFDFRVTGYVRFCPAVRSVRLVHISVICWFVGE